MGSSSPNRDENKQQFETNQPTNLETNQPTMGLIVSTLKTPPNGSFKTTT